MHSWRVDETAAPSVTGLWEDTLTMQIQNQRARGRWNDTNQTVNPPFGGERQSDASITSQNLSTVSSPRGTCTTHYLWFTM